MTIDKKKLKIAGLIAAPILLLIILLIGWKLVSGGEEEKTNIDTTQSQNQDQQMELAEQPEGFIWRQTANGWEAMQEAPDCPAQPMLKAPADLSKVTSVLYPGQVRGGTSYKPHGGLRFDKSTDNKITVTAPMDGFLIRGVRHQVDGGTEVQYGFSIMNNCGIAISLGHLRELTPALQKIVETFPEPSKSSASQNVNPPLYLKQGEVLATKIGTLTDNNTFFDWGVTDYRQLNEASQSEAYRKAHGEGNGADTAWYGVCWLQGWLPAGDEAILAKLPAGDGVNGKKSDYCK